MTEVNEYVFYDGQCPICRRWIRRSHSILVHHGMHPVPLQAPWAASRLGLDPAAPLTEMKLLTYDGQILGGAGAILHVGRHVWWVWPLFVWFRIPAFHRLLHKAYRHFADRRPCDDGICPTEPKVKRQRGIAFFEFP